VLAAAAANLNVTFGRLRVAVASQQLQEVGQLQGPGLVKEWLQHSQQLRLEGGLSSCSSNNEGYLILKCKYPLVQVDQSL